MKESDDLFLLIKSLTKNEKGYFKKVANLHSIGGKNKYVIIFDAIEKQKAYDEEALLTKFSSEKFVRQFHVAKNYLYHLILKSTEQYHNTIDITLRSSLSNIEFLFNKHLYKQAQKLVNKAMQLAVKYERFAALIEIYSIQSKLSRQTIHSSIKQKDWDDLLAAEILNIEKINNLTQYRQMHYSMHIKMLLEGRSSQTKTKSSDNSLKNIITNPLLSSEKKALSDQGKIYFYACKSSYYHLMNDNESALLNAKKLVEHFESKSELMNDNLKAYQIAISNVIASSINVKKYKDVYVYIEKLKSSDQNSKNSTYKNFFFIHQMLLTVHINLGKFSESVALIEKIQNELQNKKFDVFHKQHEAAFNYLYAYAYFGAGNYSKANTYLNKILNDSGKLQGDYYTFAKIFNIVIHYELGHFDLLESLIKSTYRYLFKKNKLLRFESLFLTFMRKTLPKTNSKKELLQAFTKLKNELTKLSNDPKEELAFSYFDLIAWLNSKINKESFAVAYRKREH